jgi:hypothetical protein
MHLAEDTALFTGLQVEMNGRLRKLIAELIPLNFNWTIKENHPPFRSTSFESRTTPNTWWVNADFNHHNRWLWLPDEVAGKR